MKERLTWPQEHVTQYRIQKLRDLTSMAYDSSAFYRRLYDRHGVHPDQIKTMSDLKLLPILRKKILLQADPMDVVELRVDVV